MLMGMHCNRRWVFLQICVLLSALGLTPVLRAQENRWKELQKRAEALQSAGNYAAAISAARDAFGVAVATYGAEDVHVAVSLTALAFLNETQGNYAEAEPLYKRALTIDEKVLGPDHPDVAASMNALANLYYHQGKYAEAEPLLKRALAIDEKALGPDHRDVAASLNNLATLYKEQGRYAEAEPLLKRALAIDEKALGPDHPDVATSLNNLATLYSDQGKYAEAEPLLKRALAIDEKALGPDHPDVAASLNNLATLYKDQGRYAEAEPLLKRALAIDEKALGPDHPDVAKFLTNMATMYYGEGRFTEAGSYYDRALQNLSTQFRYRFTYLSEKDRLQFHATVESTFSTYFSFCVSFEKQDHSLAGKMYDLLLWKKAVVGGSVAAFRRQIAVRGDAEAVKLFDELAAKKTEISRLVTLRPAGWEQAKRVLDDEANSLEGELARRVSSASDKESLANSTWRDVQKKLKQGEAAVELVRFELHNGVHWTGKTYYAALVTTPKTATGPRFIALGEAASLESVALQDYSRVIAAREAYSADASGILGRAFYRVFWKPLEPALEGAKTIYISSDGVFDQVSLGILPSEDAEPLLSKYDLRIVSSTRDLLRPAQVYTASTAVLVGNPSYDLTNEQYQASLESLNAPRQVGTAIEIRNIAAILQKQKWQVDIYEGDSALVEVVRRVHHPRVLHFATRGFFEPDQGTLHKDLSTNGEPSPGFDDPMLRSGLYFAGADRARERTPIPKALGDGILTASEVSLLDLNSTEMVVLSSCETGLGKVVAGEGVFGLLRGFQEAGADSVVISMWKVPDAQTQQLMTSFYENWLSKHMDKHEALRQAQLALRDKVKAQFGQDLPYYWGAFVLMGR